MVLLAIGGTIFGVNRDLFVYFRNSDVGTVFPSANPWQPGSTLNWVRTLFYNPCSAGMSGCVTIGGVQYGPGGAPYVNTSAGQALIQDAGLVPIYVVNVPGS